jgi:hypothetical protein
MTTLTWDEAFHQLWIHAVQHRGITVATSPGQMPDGMPQGWPRTRGLDVMAIASVVDPVVRALPIETGDLGIERRWRRCASDLANLGLARPTQEYAQNGAFWATLAATLAHLASIDAPVPHDLWRALLAEIANPGTSRDLTSEDCLHLAADSYEELWRVQKATLSELRGVDSREPFSDMSSPRWTVPRTTNADVLQLAMFWTLALMKVEQRRRAIAPDVVATLGLDGVKRRWHAVVADVDAYAKAGDPRSVYPKNHEFWRVTASVSITISAIDDMPLSLDLAIRGRLPEHRNARTYDIKETTFAKTWTAQHDQMVKTRGSELQEPLPGATDSSMQAMQVPRTTNADIVQFASYWNSAWTKLEDAWKRGDVLHRIANPPSLVGERTRWQAVMADVEKIAKVGSPSDVYPKNPEFWRASLSMANTLVALGQKPTPSQLSLDVPDESLPDRLLDVAKNLGEQIADAASSVAHVVGNIAHEAGAGLFSGFGTPLLVGLGGLAVLWLLFSHRDRETE